MNIGNVDSFERQLEEAQQLLEIDPHDYIPITYTDQPDWQYAFPSQPVLPFSYSSLIST